MREEESNMDGWERRVVEGALMDRALPHLDAGRTRILQGSHLPLHLELGGFTRWLSVTTHSL